MTAFFDTNEQPESRHVVLLYDKSTGKIQHSHEVIFMPGSKAMNKKQIEKVAFEGIRGLKSSKALAALHVSPADFKPELEYRVDPKKKSLVEVKEKQDNRNNRKSRRKSTSQPKK